MQIKQTPSSNLIECGRKFVIAITYCEQIKTKVKAIQSQILQTEEFLTPAGERVLEDRHSCSMSDDRFLTYLTRLHEKYRDAGLDPRFGLCPQEMADLMVRKATEKLINAGREANFLPPTSSAVTPGPAPTGYVAQLVGFLAPFIRKAILGKTELS
jgi:hypothetical protein